MKKLQGFTIIESVLSIAVVGAGLIGIAMAIGNISAANLAITRNIVALNIAQESMEKILARRDCNNAGCGYAATVDSIRRGSFNENPLRSNATFAVNASILEVNPDSDGNSNDDFLDSQPGSGYARITVHVANMGGANLISLKTLLVSY